MITDFTKINNKGQFLSVDGRPLSTSRGVGRDIVKLFKSHIRAAASKVQASKSVSDPFLCLQLKCPLGSYDVNIEPGKDDVLFEDRELVFSLIQTVLADHYGALPDAQMKSPASRRQGQYRVWPSHGPETCSILTVISQRSIWRGRYPTSRYYSSSQALGFAYGALSATNTR